MRHLPLRRFLGGVLVLAGLLIPFRDSPGFWIFGKDLLWNGVKLVQYVEEASSISGLLGEDLTADERDAILKFQRSLDKCAREECVEIAKNFPGTSLTGPAPSSVEDAVQFIIDQVKGTGDEAPRGESPGATATYAFGMMTRTAYEDASAQVTFFSLPMTDSDAAGLVTSGVFAVGDIISVPDAGLPEADYLFPVTPGMGTSAAVVEITAVDIPTDSYSAMIYGAGLELAAGSPLPFVSEIERLDPSHILIRALNVGGTNFMVEAGNACDLTYVTLPVVSTSNMFPTLGPLFNATEITVADGGLITAPYELRIQVDGDPVSSNHVVFDGVLGNVANQPADNCYFLCVDRSDPDADGLGTPCDNCPDTFNPDQADSNSNGVGDACEVPTGIDPDGRRITLWAYPNPFRGAVNLSVDVTIPSPLSVTVLGAAGRRVRLLHDGPVAAGVRTFVWDGRDDAGRRVPSGVYWARLASPVGTEARMLIHTP